MTPPVSNIDVDSKRFIFHLMVSSITYFAKRIAADFATDAAAVRLSLPALLCLAKSKGMTASFSTLYRVSLLFSQELQYGFLDPFPITISNFYFQIDKLLQCRVPPLTLIFGLKVKTMVWKQAVT